MFSLPDALESKPRAEFEKRYDVAFGEHYAAGGAYDAGDDLEQSGFTRAVAPDKREAFAAFHTEVYVFQHVEALVSDLELQQFDGIFLEVVYALGGHAELHGHAARVHEHFRAFAELFDYVGVFERAVHGRLAYMLSMKRLRDRRKSSQPIAKKPMPTP